MAERIVVLAADVGNTRLTVGMVDAAGRLLASEQRDNPRGAGAAASLAVLGEMLRRAHGQAPLAQAVGVGFGGPVEVATGTVRRSHHTAGWEAVSLPRELEPILGLPVMVDNDANAGGLGEALFGAGRQAHSLLYLNVGTGIGGAVLLDRRVHHGAHSNAGEIGHVVVQREGGPRCTCEKTGCLEALASGDGLGAAARRALEGDPALCSCLRDLPRAEVTGRTVSAAAGAGDALALRVLREAGGWLGFAAAAACNVLDPELVVVGGGVSEGHPAYLEAAREAFVVYATPPVAAATRIVPAQLGYQAGVIGAGAVALQALHAVQ